MFESISRRGFLALVPTVPFAFRPASPGLRRARQSPPASSAPASPSASFPAHEPDVVKEMVAVSHGNLARVKELVSARPALARASWDWGYGDWETPIDAASHVGNRPIAEYLIANGARPTIFSATMLGQLDVVKAFIAASPGIEATPGPHSITLLAHASAGGAQALPVLEYLKTLPGANQKPQTAPLTPEQLAKLTGDYVYGTGADEKISITVNSNGILIFTRAGKTGRNLNHVGDLAFYPSGAPLARVRFNGPTLTVHDPDLVVTATRA